MKKDITMHRKELLEVRKQSKLSVKTELAFLERRLNLLIDVLIPLRDGSSEDKYQLRYVTKKMEVALGAVHLAQDKFNE